MVSTAYGLTRDARMTRMTLRWRRLGSAAGRIFRFLGQHKGEVGQDCALRTHPCAHSPFRRLSEARNNESESGAIYSARRKISLPKCTKDFVLHLVFLTCSTGRCAACASIGHTRKIFPG